MAPPDRQAVADRRVGGEDAVHTTLHPPSSGQPERTRRCADLALHLERSAVVTATIGRHVDAAARPALCDMRLVGSRDARPRGRTVLVSSSTVSSTGSVEIAFLARTDRRAVEQRRSGPHVEPPRVGRSRTVGPGLVRRQRLSDPRRRRDHRPAARTTRVLDRAGSHLPQRWTSRVATRRTPA